MSESSPAADATTVPVLDYRRRSMMLQWHALGGTWTPCELPPDRVHGIALISATGPNICVFGRGGRLLLQIGPDQYVLAENSPRIICRPGLIFLGLRRRFIVRSSSGEMLYSHRYWRGQGGDFFRWLARHAGDTDWRSTCGIEWSEGIEPTALPRE
jgi:hypothetical protein